jgi:hypothetical protein
MNKLIVDIKIISVVIIKFFIWFDNEVKIIHLGKNPNVGGTPPKASININTFIFRFLLI